jgi:hypothetical protein
MLVFPKLYADPTSKPGFTIYTPAESGMAGVCVLHGIESPGLTSSLSLVREIATKIQKAN